VDFADDLEREMRQQTAKAPPVNVEARRLWADLVGAEKLSGLDGTIDDQIRQICYCSGEVDTIEIAREDYLHQLENAANIGKRAGFNDGWAEASVKARGAGIQFAHERIRMEKTIRRLWWTVAIAVMASGAVVLAWVVTQF